VRPPTHAKQAFGQLDAPDIWMTSPWTGTLAYQALKLDLKRVELPPWTPKGNRALSFMVQQYARHLERLAERVGGWSEAGQHLGAMVEALDGKKGPQRPP
jgi:hypothetical protein